MQLLKDPIVDFADFDVNRLIADKATIETYIPHRGEMSFLDGILFECGDSNRSVGIKNVQDNEFWVAGHFPQMPVMPGVVACECAAQLSAYHASRFKMVDGILGLGSLDIVKFRGRIVPGDQLVLMISRKKFRPGQLFISHFQIFVEKVLVVDGLIKGVLLPSP
ncbi:MAG TPA: beta-hydroxyacyl-ACP dehydratase [Pirellulaceae bacterium]|nr:beta-hydroxyacyl-ACP dehydratase [Pirellulaceae bacterium]HMO93620.1 beta-hydroxyacyl-ACP dehydratase [Pirellulaceae bacterium]HMP70492.1 beta-hydroxyacyl-ACP dehydratase [Pirellulaceae bacterium]